MALYTEGETDERFLAPLIKKLAQELLEDIEVFDIAIFRSDKKKAVDKIVDVAQKTLGYQVLIIHADADDESMNKALKERLQPGFDQVKKQSDACQSLVPIIPIQETEAWLLADKETLRELIGTNKTNEELKLNFPLKQIEQMANPKEKLQEVIKQVGRKSVKISTLYQPLGQAVSFDVLKDLSAFSDFKQKLIEAFRSIGYIKN